MADLEQEEISLVIVILDINPTQRIIIDSIDKFSHIVDSLITFSNAHLMLKSNNKLAFIASDSFTSSFVLSEEDVTAITTTSQPDGQYEIFGHVQRTIKKNIKEFVCNVQPKIGDSLIAGACTMALCYMHRLENESVFGNKMNSRILIVTGSSDSSSQYMNYMNVFFTAQKQNIIIDVCSLDQDLGLLQQGCDITGGVYLKIPNMHSLLQYLFWVFLPEPPLRKKLILPPPVKVDYRASCFCHRQLVDIGYVCSVCLSVFCKFSPICTTCHALFKTPGPLPSKIKKKKLK